MTGRIAQVSERMRFVTADLDAAQIGRLRAVAVSVALQSHAGSEEAITLADEFVWSPARARLLLLPSDYAWSTSQWSTAGFGTSGGGPRVPRREHWPPP